jgi:hypothetical protein
MTHSRADTTRIPRKARLRPGLLATAAVTVLIAVACGGGSASAPKASGTGPAQTTVQQIDAYSQCMRKHGEPNFSLSTQATPGAPVLFGYTIEGANPSSPQYVQANEACASLLPQHTLPALTEAELHKMVRSETKEAACMRAHGYPSFPDPAMSHGHPVLLPAPGTDTASPQFQAAEKACG